MSRIILAGFFLWAWGLWHLAWLVGLVWIGVAMLAFGLDPVWAALFFAGMYTVFLPLEIVGELQNRKHRDGRARTLSEFRQYLPVTHGKGGSMTGWKALGLTGIIDATIMGWLVYQLHPLVGTVIAGALAGVLSAVLTLVLVPHFGVRERVG